MSPNQVPQPEADTDDPVEDALQSLLLSGITFTAQASVISPTHSRLTIETATGVHTWAEYDGEDFIRGGSELNQLATLPVADHMLVDRSTAVSATDVEQAIDDGLNPTHELHKDLVDLVSTLVALGWQVRVRHLAEPDDVREAGVEVEAALPNDATTDRLNLAFPDEVTGLRLMWDLQEVESDDGQVTEWGFDPDETGVATSVGLHPLTHYQLFGVAISAAPESLVPAESCVPIQRHRDSAPMPISALASLLERAAKPPTDAELAERRRRVADWAQKNGFGTTPIPPVTKRVTEVLTGLGKGTAGYYLLEFANGQCYVGQSISIDTRLTQHRQVHGDIVGVRLQPDPFVPRGTDPLPYLLQRERELIRDAQQSGLAQWMRNKAEMTIIPGNSQLLDRELLDQMARDEWISDPVDVNARDLLRTPRFTTAQRKEQDHEDRCQAMLARAGQHGQTVLEALSAYIRRCLPLPLSTEFEFWTVSTPSNFGTRAACLSIGMTEALTFFIDRTGTFHAFFQVNATELFGAQDGGDDKLLAFLRNHPGVAVRPATFRDSGPDNLLLSMDTPGVLLDLLDDTAVTRAAATAALNLMRVRPSGKKRKESHNPALAGLILGLTS